MMNTRHRTGRGSSNQLIGSTIAKKIANLTVGKSTAAPCAVVGTGAHGPLAAHRRSRWGSAVAREPAPTRGRMVRTPSVLCRLDVGRRRPRHKERKVEAALRRL